MGFGDRLARSWRLGKESWAVLRANPTFMLFPVISTLVLVVVMAATAGAGVALFPGLVDDASSGSTSNAAGLVVLFVFYLISYTVMIFFNTALVSAVLTYMDGDAPSVGGALALARSRITAIVGYAAIAATVGVLLSVLRERGGIAGAIASLIGNVAWNFATYFVAPVLAAEGVGPVEAIKRSSGLFRRTWGEQIASGIGLGIFGFIIMLPALIIGGGIILVGFATGSIAGVIPAVIIGGLIIALAATMLATLGTIFRAALYRYATAGEFVPGFDADLIRNAFTPKEPRGARGF
ncbi:MAG: hypothetical protein DCC58_16075 [Chloroflexi bacterium]|nr:MAG: hypothetical protein DCC58_16075 [Chloroflexota bacterium]